MREWREASDVEFRTAFRAWLDSHYPPEWRQSTLRPFYRLRGEQITTWLRLLQSGGWRAPTWPVEHGGLDLSFSKQRIYQEELERAKVARVLDFGEQMLGPVLMEFGTPEQRERLLPRILECSDVWCQGYSEPNAGSDLASLQTSAAVFDDRFVVIGQKIWTTHAQDSTHMFTLVRTERSPRKQDGISFLLIDLSSPGVDVRPIANIAGEEEYCEVFLRDVEVPRENLVGQLHQGWSVAKALLGHERIFVGSPAMARMAFAVAQRAVKAFALSATSRQRLHQLAADLHDYEALYRQICGEAEMGSPIGERVVMLKIYATELTQRICDFVADIAGENAGALGPFNAGSESFDIHWQMMMSRPITIFGGANEVQRDILAKRVLNLPSR
jgi:3-oxochol-4-en-24-oyl-CoA dehydrogenase